MIWRSAMFVAFTRPPGWGPSRPFVDTAVFCLMEATSNRAGTALCANADADAHVSETTSTGCVRLRMTPPRLAGTPRILVDPLENLAGLTREFPAERLECREANRPRLAGLEDGQVGERDADAIGELGQRQASIEQQAIQIDSYSHLIASDRERLLFVEPRALAKHF